MKFITIFSTKLIDEKGTLFHNAERIFSSALKEYFDRVMPRQIIPNLTESNWWDVYKQYHFSDEVFMLEWRKSTSFREELWTKAFDEIKTSTGLSLDNKVQGAFQFFKDALLAIKKNKDDELLRIRDGKLTERSTLYALPSNGSDYFAFAIPALTGSENDDEEGSRGWIEQLINCSMEITQERDILVQLILHDKDLGGIFQSRDVYVLNSADEIQKYTSFPKCNIVFFKHTSNEFVDIIRTPRKSAEEVFKATKDAIAKFSKTRDILRELDECPYESASVLNTASILDEKINELYKSQQK